MPRHFGRYRWLIQVLSIGIGLVLAIVFSLFPVARSQPLLALNPASLVDAQPHPLPSALATWVDTTRSGDYFDQIKPVEAGYLVWSRFPVTVYVQPPTPEDARYPFLVRRAKDWQSAILQAVQEWNRYLPLEVVDQPETADITVWRSSPPLRLERPAQPIENTGDRRSPLPISRARSAETRFELYLKPGSNKTTTGGDRLLAHRFKIYLRPDQSPAYLLAAARHELGHAMGIWGHSPLPSDALYFSQVRHPPLISPRDINTLKRIYQQPTQLGWQVK